MRNKDQMNRSIMVLAAQRYAQANASDPFAYARAMTHINNGIATYAVGKEATPGYYDAEEYTGDYGQRLWKNVGRV